MEKYYIQYVGRASNYVSIFFINKKGKLRSRQVKLAQNEIYYFTEDDVLTERQINYYKKLRDIGFKFGSVSDQCGIVNDTAIDDTKSNEESDSTIINNVDFNKIEEESKEDSEAGNEPDAINESEANEELSTVEEYAEAPEVTNETSGVESELTAWLDVTYDDDSLKELCESFGIKVGKKSRQKLIETLLKDKYDEIVKLYNN